MVEAKCYARGRPVGIEVARNAVGVLKDISENFFTYIPIGPAGTAVQVPRFNYHAAIFATSGYTAGAQRFAIAHQIFLIQYERVSLLEPVVDGLLLLRDDHLRGLSGDEAEISARLRSDLRQMLQESGNAVQRADSALSPEGFEHVRDGVVGPLLRIEGSYFGMLQGKWPMHLLSRRPLPEAAFLHRDAVPCRVYGRNSDRWSFSPIGVQEGEPAWFRLEFDIPEEIVGFVGEARNDPFTLAAVKQANFSFLDLAGKIGGLQRQVRLRLDGEWLDAYLQRILGRRGRA